MSDEEFGENSKLPSMRYLDNDAETMKLRSNWMAVSVIQASKIWDLTFPGTHNSATYDIKSGTGIAKSDEKGVASNRAVMKLAERYIRCQTLTIGQQLEYGVRFIDLRVFKNISSGIGEPYCAHAGFRTVPFAEVLRDITSFLEKHPSEIVILSVRRDVRARSGPMAIPLIEVDFWISVYLGPYLGTKLRTNTTVAEILERKQQIVYCFNDIERYLPTPRELQSSIGHATRLGTKADSVAFITLTSVVQTEALPRKLDFAALLNKAKKGTLGASEHTKPLEASPVAQRALQPSAGDLTPAFIASEEDLRPQSLSSLSQASDLPNQSTSSHPTSSHAGSGHPTKHVVLPSPAPPGTPTLTPQIPPSKEDEEKAQRIAEALSPPTQPYHTPSDPDALVMGCTGPRQRKRRVSRETEKKKAPPVQYDQDRLGKLLAAALNEKLSSFELVGDDSLRWTGDGPTKKTADEDECFFELAWRGGIVQYCPPQAASHAGDRKVTGDSRSSLVEEAFRGDKIVDERGVLGGRVNNYGAGVGRGTESVYGDSRFATMPRGVALRLSLSDAQRYRSIGLSREYFIYPLVGKLARDFVYASPFKTGRTLIEKSWGQTCECNEKFLIQKLKYWTLLHGKKPPRPAYRFRVLAAEVTPPSPEFPLPASELMKFWAQQSAATLLFLPAGLRHVAENANQQILQQLINKDIVCRVNAITHDFMDKRIVLTILYIQLKYLTHRQVQLPLLQPRAATDLSSRSSLDQPSTDRTRTTQDEAKTQPEKPSSQPTERFGGLRHIRDRLMGERREKSPTKAATADSGELNMHSLVQETVVNAQIIRQKTAQRNIQDMASEESEGEVGHEIIDDTEEKQGEPGDQFA